MILHVPNLIVPFLERALRKMARDTRDTAPFVAAWAEQAADALRYEQTKDD